MSDTESKSFFVKLPRRGIVRVAGADRHAFLQDLVTNDLDLLDDQPVLYSCLLTPQGKFLHDFFISHDDSTIILECEGGERAEDLMKRLMQFKLRSKVDITVEKDVPAFSIPDATTSQGYRDPRHRALGWRCLRNAPPGMDERPFALWDMRRICLGIPDGSRDIVVGSDTLIECNIDKLKGVSFHKGCYVGQEITVRMNMRGLAKKHLYTVQISGNSVPTDIYLEGKVVGAMRSNCGGVGLALLKDEAAHLLKEGPVRIFVPE